MFKFLKDKLKGALDKFSKKVDEEGKEEVIEEEKQIVPQEEAKKAPQKEKPQEIAKAPEKPEEAKPAEKPEEAKAEAKPEKPEAEAKLAEEPEKQAKEKPAEEPEAKPAKEAPEPEPTAPEKTKKPEATAEPEKPVEKKVEETKAEKIKKPEVTPAQVKAQPEAMQAKEEEKPAKGLFKRFTEKITTKKITEEQFEELFWELEITLLENNVAVEVIEKLKTDLKKQLVDKPIPRKAIQERILETLKQSVQDLFQAEGVDITKAAKEKKPYVITFVGVNGSGKTTTIAKLAHRLKEKGLSTVIAAGDTFRAAAIDQLQLHADRLNIKLIKHGYGADAAAVVYDAIEHAKAKKIDVVLVDTAGRLHSNVNLMDEMKKIIRIGKPDLKVFVGESITGNDCVEQAQKFNEAIGLDGIILTKADVDEKGGAALSISYVTGKPILYLGMGQKYEDLKPFDINIVLTNLGLT